MGFLQCAHVPREVGPPLSTSFIWVVRFFNRLSRSSPAMGFATLEPPVGLPPVAGTIDDEADDAGAVVTGVGL